MKLTSPRKRGRAWVIAALLLGLSSVGFGASYTLQMFAEAHPGKYTFAPDAALASELGDYHTLATSSSNGVATYWSFCLEYTEYFQHGKTYNAESGYNPVTGGSSTDSGDPISVATAYLFEQFVLGNLGSVLTYDAGGGKRLQQMVWFLEGEAGGHLDTQLWDLVSTKFTDPYADYTGSAVGVLVLTKYSGAGGDSLSGTLRQDQLVYWGSPKQVPDGGTTLLLFGASLTGLGLLKRRQKI